MAVCIYERGMNGDDKEEREGVSERLRKSGNKEREGLCVCVHARVCMYEREREREREREK